MMRTLFLALEDFRSRDRGSRIRDWYTVEALAALGDVTVLTFTPGPTIDARWNADGVEFLTDDPTNAVKALVRMLLHGTMYHVERYNFAAHKEIRAVQSQAFDLVVASQIYPMAHLEQVVGPRDTRPPVLWDTHNFDPDVWEARSGTGSLSRKTFAKVMRPRAAALVDRSVLIADGIVACTSVDGDSWEEISEDTPVTVAPNAVDLGSWRICRDAEGDRNTFVLFGSLNQASTRAGAVWFLEQVWPGYVDADPGARLIVVGREPGRDLIARVQSASRAELIADPIELQPVVERAGTVVVPQVWGTGSKLKMVEALASGRRIIASPSAMVGLPADVSGFVDVAESGESWYEAMTNASSQPRSARELGDLVELLSSTLSWRVSQRRFIEAALAVTSR